MTSSWAAYFQSFRAPWLDTLVYYITNLGSEWFYMIALPILYWMWSKRGAYRVATFYLFSVYVNGLLKTAFKTPRPQPTQDLAVLHPETGTGYAFPSGHAQGSTVFWGQLSLETRKRWVAVAGIVIIALVSLSRLYLNVHWPIDVLGGFLIGLALLALFNAAGSIWRNLEPRFAFRLIGAVLIPVIMYLTYRGDDAYIVTGFMLGFPVGALLEERYVGWNEKTRGLGNVFKLLIGFGGLFLIRFGLKLVFPETVFADVIRYALAGFYASFIAPLIFLSLGLG